MGIILETPLKKAVVIAEDALNMSITTTIVSCLSKRG